jgi:hypothetical protein
MREYVGNVKLGACPPAYGSIVLLLDLGRFFSFLNLYSRISLRTTQTQNKLTQTSMPRMGFEPTIPAFERA